MRDVIYALFILSNLLITSNCMTRNATNEKKPVGGPVVEIRYPKRLHNKEGNSKQGIRKEDPSEVEEFLQDDPLYYNNRGIYPNNNYPGGYNPFGPQYPNDGFVPGAAVGGFDAFTARKAIDFDLVPGRRIRFLDTVSHIGNGWKNFTSEFICDTPGVYFFTFTACGERFRHFRITLKHNDIGVVSAYGDQNGYQMATNSVVLRLFLLDRVYLQLDEGGIYEVSTLTGRAYNTFSGFRIF